MAAECTQLGNVMGIGPSAGEPEALASGISPLRMLLCELFRIRGTLSLTQHISRRYQDVSSLNQVNQPNRNDNLAHTMLKGRM